MTQSSFNIAVEKKYWFNTGNHNREISFDNIRINLNKLQLSTFSDELTLLSNVLQNYFLLKV